MDKFSQLLDQVRDAYLQEMDANGGHYPYKTAHEVAHRRLALQPNALVELISSAPKLLASRAGDLIDDERELKNPSVGAIISANLVAAGMEGLVMVAVNRGWLERDDEGDLLVDAHELDLTKPIAGVDYSVSQGEFEPKPDRSFLSELFGTAERAFEEALESQTVDAYPLSLSIAAEHAVFTPEDLAPLLVENPLMLGLRNDDLVDPDMFDNDPPAGMILSAHLTEMMVSQMIDRAIEKGALAMDSEGQPLLDDDAEETPTVH